MQIDNSNNNFISKKNQIFDSIIIIFILSINLSIIQDIFYGNISSVLRIILNICIIGFSLIIRFKNKILLSSDFIFFPLLIVIIWFLDIVQLLSLGINYLYVFLIYLELFLFSLYLTNTFNYHLVSFSCRKKAFYETIKPYIIFSLYNVIIVIIAFLLIFFKLIHHNSNPVEYSLFSDNIEHGVKYYFPYFISVIRDTQFRLSLLGDIPYITGLSHEPHVLCFLVMPSLFFIFSFDNIKKQYLKFLILISYLFVAIISVSTTSIIILVLIFVIKFIYNIINNKNTILYTLATAILIIICLPIFYAIYKEVIHLKVFSETGSLDYSRSLILYLVTPTSIIGNGTTAMPAEIFNGNAQVGIISSLLVFSFLIYLYYKIVRFIFSKDYMIHIIGLGLLYFSLHMLKLGNLIFEYPYLVFMIMIPFYYCNLESKNRKQHK